MNAAKFDRLTFENLKKYPKNNVDFFIDKFGFDDEDDFANNLQRIYSISRDEAVGIINKMKKKEEKAKRKEEKRAMKAKKTGKIVKNNPIDINVIADKSSVAISNITENTSKTDKVDMMSNNIVSNTVEEALAKAKSEMSMENRAEEVCSIVTEQPETTEVTKVTEVPKVIEDVKVSEASEVSEVSECVELPGVSELDSLKVKLAKDENLILEIIEDIAKKTELCEKILSNINDCTERVKQIQDELESEKKKAEENVLLLHETENSISESIDMKKMVLEEMSNLKSRIEELEVTKLYFCNPLIASSKDIIANDVQVDTDMVTAKLMTIVTDERLKEMQMPIGMISDLARDLAIIEKISAENGTKKMVLVFNSVDDVLAEAIAVMTKEMEIEVI